MTPHVSISREGPIATVALHNPGKLNAITASMWQELGRGVRALSADAELRCVVLRGGGTAAFAAGADIPELAQIRDSAERARVFHREFIYGALEALARCEHPTIAMIRGACVGGGLELACQCDLRISGESGRFGVPISRLGFPIAYDELHGLLPLVGRAVALEMLVEGRIWNAAEALGKGLLTRVVSDASLEAEVYASAERIAEAAPLVARWHKRFVRRLRAEPAALTPRELASNFDYLATEDYRRGHEAFTAKRKPKFVGR